MYSLYICYFTFGFCLSFGSIAMNFEMMDSLKFTPVEMTMSYGVMAAPWCIKPVFGMISDKYKIIDWGKRRPYIFFCGFLLAYLYMMVPKLVETKESMVGTMTFISFLMCFADVCADCITVDYAKRELERGRTQGNCWTSRALGSVVGAMFGGSCYDQFGTKVVFQIMSLPCLLMAMLVWQLQINITPSANDICKKICKSVYKKRPLAFAIFAMSIGPNYAPFYTYYLRKELKYSPVDFQWISIASAWSFLAATFIYKQFLLGTNPLKLMEISVYVGVCCQLIQLLVVTKTITSLWIVVLDTIGESLFGILMLMPLIVAVAHHAKDGIEGTFYALLMALSNLSTVIADEIGGLIGNLLGVTRDNFDNMVFLIIICALSDLAFQLWVIKNKHVAVYFQAAKSSKDRKISHHKKGQLENPGGTDHTLERLDDLDHTPVMLDVNTSGREGMEADSEDLLETTEENLDEKDHMPATVVELVQNFASMVMPPSGYRAVRE